MNYSENQMTSEPKIKLDIMKVFIIIIVLCFMVLLVISLMQIFRQNPYGDELRIDNLSSYVPNLPQDKKDSMFATLYKTVSSNLSNGQTAPRSGARIRDNSASSAYDEKTDIYSGEFIVDIESVGQSFRVQYEWSPTENNPNLSSYSIVITCLPEDQLIYGYFPCRDMQNDGSFSPINTISFYLPYYGKTKTGANFVIQKRNYNSGREYLEVNINSCGDQNLLAEAEEAAKEWVETYHINPEDLSFEIRDLCDGGAM